MSSMARVIFFVDSTDLIRARYSRSETAIGQPRFCLTICSCSTSSSSSASCSSLPALIELALGGLELVEEGVVARPPAPSAVSSVKSCDSRIASTGCPRASGAGSRGTPRSKRSTSSVGHLVEPAGRAGPQRDRHLLDRVGRVLRLLEQRHQPLTTVELLARRGVEVGGEHRERLHRAELRQVDLERAGDLLHRLGHRRTAHAGHRDTDVDRRTLVGVEQVGLQEDLAVGDRDDVGRDVRRHVVGLGLDDRQTRSSSRRRGRRTASRSARAAGCAGRTRHPGRPRGPAGGAAAATRRGRPRPAW